MIINMEEIARKTHLEFCKMIMPIVTAQKNIDDIVKPTCECEVIYISDYLNGKNNYGN